MLSPVILFKNSLEQNQPNTINSQENVTMDDYTNKVR